VQIFSLDLLDQHVFLIAITLSARMDYVNRQSAGKAGILMHWWLKNSVLKSLMKHCLQGLKWKNRCWYWNHWHVGCRCNIVYL